MIYKAPKSQKESGRGGPGPCMCSRGGDRRL